MTLGFLLIGRAYTVSNSQIFDDEDAVIREQSFRRDLIHDVKPYKYKAFFDSTVNFNLEHCIPIYSPHLSEFFSWFTGQLFFDSAGKESAGSREEGVGPFRNSWNVWEFFVFVGTGEICSLNVVDDLKIWKSGIVLD